MDDDLELEEFWEDIRRRPAVAVVNDRVTNLKGQLLVASEKTSFELAQKFKTHSGAYLTGELLAQIITEGVKVFMEKWFEGLRNQDLSGLIEIVLEGQKLSAVEMTGFVRALPEALITKIVDSAIASGTGIHALMALEKHRRTNGQEYSLGSTSDGVRVRFSTPNGQEIDFGLYETFNLSEPKTDTTDTVNT